jgi:hypothetical protein
MAFQFQDTLHRTASDAVDHVAEAWIYGGMARPYPETLEDDPVRLARECIDGWHLAPTLAEWGATETQLAQSMAATIAGSRWER